MTGSVALVDIEGGDGDVDDQKTSHRPDDHYRDYDQNMDHDLHDHVDVLCQYLEIV